MWLQRATQQPTLLIHQCTLPFMHYWLQPPQTSPHGSTYLAACPEMCLPSSTTSDCRVVEIWPAKDPWAAPPQFAHSQQLSPTVHHSQPWESVLAAVLRIIAVVLSGGEFKIGQFQRVLQGAKGGRTARGHNRPDVPQQPYEGLPCCCPIVRSQIGPY
jgi:hypothetical protein